jgi:predicted nucleotidyltransferase
MSKIPDKPQDVFVPLTEDYKKVFGKDLVSLILYGSAAGGHYIKGKSDINVLVVLAPESVNKLEEFLSVVKRWKKSSVAVPLVMTKEFIDNSLDCYPIEFLNMKNNHILIYGEDILAQLNFRPENLRLQIERELKGKLVFLRQSYLDTDGKSKQIKELISRSLTAFISIFNALIYLKKGIAPQRRRDTIKELAGLFSVDAEVFSMCADIKEGVDKLSGEEVADIFKKYLHEVEKICNIVDGI